MGASAPIKFPQAESGLAQLERSFLIASGLSFFFIAPVTLRYTRQKILFPLQNSLITATANDHLSRITTK
jgi:hypothetical protein